MTEIYDKGFTMRSLYNFVNFYRTHGNLFVLKTDTNILQALPAKSPTLLSRTHYVILLQMAELIRKMKTKHLEEFESYTQNEPMFASAQDVLEFRDGF